MKFNRQTLSMAMTATTLVAVALVPAQAQADEGDVTIYFTRHAEKMTTTTVVDDKATNYSISYDADGIATVRREPGKSDGDQLDEVCNGIDDCAEELNALGLKRADLLAEYFGESGIDIVDEIDAVYSSHKYRTFQTVLPTADAAGTTVVQLPGDQTELSAGAGASECPTLEAIRAAEPGQTLVVAGHSGTLYDIMGDGNGDCMGLGLLMDDDPSSDAFPKKSNGKVRDFGDLWEVTYDTVAREAQLVKRVQLDFVDLEVINMTAGAGAH